jgi:lipoate-protein ligase A
MNLLISEITDPYRNLATEEFLLKHSNEDFIFLYIDRPCVVVGKHQIALKEINPKFIFESKALLARRLSGGGAVYHDEGNLNFSFIQSTKHDGNPSYKLISKSILSFLKELNFDANLSLRNDLLIEERKISGSAMHVFKNRVLAHCTLLIDCNLENLSASLKGNSERYSDKSISSVRSSVTNLAAFDQKIITSKVLFDYTIFLQKEFDNIRKFTIPDLWQNEIIELVENKYSTNEWIYGYSPKYLYRSSVTLDKQTFKFVLEIEKGIINSIAIESIKEIDENINLKLNMLIGKQHHPLVLAAWLKSHFEPEFAHALISSLF